MRTLVYFSSKAEKQLLKIPREIQESLKSWVDSVIRFGLYETSKISGYNMEHLKGNRTGQRSIRLNKAYRAIFEVNKNGEIHIVTIVEVNKHEY